MSNKRRNIVLLVGMLMAVIVSAVGLPFGAFDTNSHVAKAYVPYANLGQVLFVPGGPVYIYDAAAGQVTTVLLPKDADGNGFDSYIVWKCSFVGEALWLGLFTGSDVPGWVPFTSAAGINATYPFNPAVCPK